MMQKTIFLALFVLTPLTAQNKFSVSFNPGTSLENSEETMKIIGDKKVGWSPGISVAYDRSDVLGLDLHLEYNFTWSKVDSVLIFIRSSSLGPNILDSYSADLFLSSHNLDIAADFEISEGFSLAIGPTISLTGRTIEMVVPATEQEPVRTFKDRLASLGLGFNSSVNMEIPFEESPEYGFFFVSLKVRYVHSIWFDKRGRNVDDYYQSFIVGQANIGFGYSF